MVTHTWIKTKSDKSIIDMEQTEEKCQKLCSSDPYYESESDIMAKTDPKMKNVREVQTEKQMEFKNDIMGYIMKTKEMKNPQFLEPAENTSSLFVSRRSISSVMLFNAEDIHFVQPSEEEGGKEILC